MSELAADHGDDGPARPPRAEAAQRLLDAGRALTTATTPADLLPKVRAVCHAAGVSPSTFYWHFQDAEAYWRELIRDLLQHDPVRDFAGKMQEALASAADAIRADPSVAVPTIAALASSDLDFHRQEGVDALRLQLALTGVAQDDGPLTRVILEEYRALYDVISDAHVRGYHLLLGAWGRVPREPFDFQSLSVTITALADGMLMRGLFDTESDLVTLFEDGIAALLATATRRVEDGDDLPSFLDEQFG